MTWPDAGRAVLGVLLPGLLLVGCAAAPPRTSTPIVQHPAPPVQPTPRVEHPQVTPLGESRIGRPERLPERLPMPMPPAMPDNGVTTLPGTSGIPSAPAAVGAEPAADGASAAQPQAAAPTNPVVVSMLSAADQYQQSGDLDRASSSVERGLRVAPRDAHLWQRLARIRLQQGRYQQAEEMAKKSTSLAQGNRGLVAQNWLLIGEARGRMGDTSGAAEARDRATRLQ
ncbi:MAG: tetratricopeptide repeat protein [Thiotrichales bacterium]